MSGLLYTILLGILFVRVRSPEGGTPVGAPVRAEPGEPLWLVHLHHRLFYLLLFGSPAVAWWMGSGRGWMMVGGLCFAAGVVLYRSAGSALGPSLSPLVLPRPGAILVTGGIYRFVRHPMYLGQALMALGAPLLAGVPILLPVAVLALGVLGWRMLLEDAALARTYPEFTHYAAETRRIVPFVL